LEQPREVSFQIGATPQVNQIGKELLLLNPSVLTAKDLFTNMEIKFETKEKESFLGEDPAIGNNYRVVN
jgi:hypothetical protein